MLHIVFEYKDRYTCDGWSWQECLVDSIQQAIDIYGLGIDCEYRIISVEEVI